VARSSDETWLELVTRGRVSIETFEAAGPEGDSTPPVIRADLLLSGDLIISVSEHWLHNAEAAARDRLIDRHREQVRTLQGDLHEAIGNVGRTVQRVRWFAGGSGLLSGGFAARTEEIWAYGLAAGLTGAALFGRTLIMRLTRGWMRRQSRAKLVELMHRPGGLLT
jgi:hypothetical protein